MQISNANISRRLEPVEGDDDADGEIKTVMQGFDVSLTFDTFKGYQTGNSMEVTFAIRTMYQKKNLLFDLGLYLVAHFYRRGLFGTRTPEQLWSGLEDPGATAPEVAAATAGRNMLVKIDQPEKEQQAMFLKPKQGAGLGFKEGAFHL